MNSNIFANIYIHFGNDYFNLLSLVYYNIFKYKRSKCIPKSLSLKKRIVCLNLKGKILKSLDLSNFYFLKYLDCSWNFLKNLDLSSKPRIIYLNTYPNQLTSLNLENNPQIKTLGYTPQPKKLYFDFSKLDRSFQRFLEMSGNNDKVI